MPGTDAKHEDDIVTNMALAISVQDRYERCLSEEKHQKIQEERILSQLWFKFQFWLKNPCVHFSVNFTGRLKVRYKSFYLNTPERYKLDLMNTPLLLVPTMKIKSKSESLVVLSL